MLELDDNLKIKRFFAKDMRLALLQVKDELGADAVIMSNKKVSGGVEIVAAVDGEPHSASSQTNYSTSASASDEYTQLSNVMQNELRELQDDRVSLQSGQQKHNSSFQSDSSNNTGRYFQELGSRNDVLLPNNSSYLNRNVLQNQHSQDEKSMGGRNVAAQAPAESPSISKRFASILKQYGHNDEESAENNADSLAALLKRQSDPQRNKANPYKNTLSHTSLNNTLSKESALSRLITQEPKIERQTPKLDPTRYERSRSEQRYADNNSDKELEQMGAEIASIRRLLEHQVSGLMWQEVERREPLRAMLIKRLERMGVSAELADQLAGYIPEDTPPNKAWKTLLDLLVEQIPITKQDLLRRGGVVALLGPTGVGKTTTIAKLAARAAMEYGAENVALVTTDSYRIGAHEQLSIYGRIMGCSVRIAKNSNELADVIYQLRNRKLILVDTAGMGQRDIRLSEQLDTLMQDSGEVIHSYLVLPATAQRRVLQETIEHFRRIPLSGCILTKLDESLSLGEFISVVVQNALPVAYVANGQRVPEDIVVAQPKYMVAKANDLLEKSTENEPHYWNSDL